MGKLEWLKNALIKNNESNTGDTGTPQPQPQQKTVVNSSPTPKRKVTPISTPTTPINIPVPESNGDELDEDYLNHLSEFMDKNNQPGPDYLEFANSLDETTSELEGVTEEKIFQMTYKVGYKQSLPVPKLLETAGVYINLFNQHKKEFDDYLTGESQKKVGSKVEENNKLSKTKSDNLKKIEDFTKQIATLESNNDSIDTQMEQNTSVIDTETKILENKKLKFEKAFNFVVGKINDDISKIKLYLSNIK